MNQTVLENISSTPKLASKGVVVIAHAKNEWLLPWWKLHFLIQNTLPVTFLDAGLSPKARKWCVQSEQVLDIPEELKKKMFENLSLSKTAALLFSPFEMTLVIEPFMQVCHDLRGIFDYLTEDKPLGFVADSLDLFVGKTTHPITKAWLENHQRLDAEKYSELPAIYNWPSHDENPFACLINHKEKKAQKLIREQIRFFEKELYMRLSF